MQEAMDVTIKEEDDDLSEDGGTNRALTSSVMKKVETDALNYDLNSHVVEKQKRSNDDFAMKAISEELSSRVRKPSAFVARVLKDQTREYEFQSESRSVDAVFDNHTEETEWFDGQDERNVQQWNEHAWTGQEEHPEEEWVEQADVQD